MAKTLIAYLFLGLVFITIFNLIPYYWQLYTFDPKIQPSRFIGSPQAPPPFNQSANPVCKSFQFVRAEWTLYWLSIFDPTIETESCREDYYNIFKEKSLKWIIYPNKSIENRGCTRHTPACRPSAHFDYRHKIRINTPPCCKAKLLEILKIITQGFQRLNIPHILFGGAVIGWIRYGGFIPYDEDLDILVDGGKHWRSKAFLKFIDETKQKYGFKYTWRKDMKSFSIDYSSKNDNGIGFWAMQTIKGGKVRIPNDENRDQPYSNIYPPRKVNFRGIATFVPNNPRLFCDIRYGKGKWQKKFQCKKLHGRKCVG